MKYIIFFFFHIYMETQNGHNVPFLESASPRKRKRKAMKIIKEKYEISKKGNKKEKFINDCIIEGIFVTWG